MKNPTIKELLSQYNQRATAAGVPTLKAWKGPRAALEAKLGELENDELTVAQIAGELDIDPKVARGKLRRAGLKAVDGRWPTVRRNGADYKKIVGVLVTEEEFKKIVADAADPIE